MDPMLPTLRPLLDTIVAGITRVLGEGIVGVYLFGSAVSGGFDAGVSDIDLVVVTAPEVVDIDLVGLDRFHHDIIAGRTFDDAGPGGLAYTILSLCRALRTVRTGEPCSKQEAAASARASKPAWAWLIDTALRTRRSRGTSGFEEPTSRVAAQEFIRLTGDEIAASILTEPSM
jgi:predicted nucleotidyltransferase